MADAKLCHVSTFANGGGATLLCVNNFKNGGCAALPHVYILQMAEAQLCRVVHLQMAEAQLCRVYKFANGGGTALPRVSYGKTGGCAALPRANGGGAALPRVIIAKMADAQLCRI
jgi:hypothetical protein